MLKNSNSSPVSDRYALLVVGMHRSGTSAFTRVCNLLGVPLGEKLMPAAKGNNEAGFWEHASIVNVHDRLYEVLQSCWDDTRFLPDNWHNDVRVRPFAEELIRLINGEFIKQPCWALKDPRLCRLLPLWKEILQSLHIRPVAVLSMRHPLHVAMSLKQRDRFSVTKSLLIWLQHVLLSEKESRDMERVVAYYDHLMTHTEMVMENVANTLHITWPVAYMEAKTEIDRFLNQELHHHRDAKEMHIPEADVRQWVEKVWEAVAWLNTEKEPKAREVFTQVEQAMKERLAALGPFLDDWIYETITERSKLKDIDTKYHVLKQQFEVMKETYDPVREKLTAAEERLEECDRVIAAQTRTIHETQHSAALLQGALDSIRRSTSWRITRPLRIIKKICGLMKVLYKQKSYVRLVQVIRQWGLKGALQKFYSRIKAYGIYEAFYWLGIQAMLDPHYDEWVLQYDTLSSSDRKKIREHIQSFSYKPLISVVMPVYNIEEIWLREAIESVRAQLYPHWELCIADDCSPAPHIRQVLEEYEAKDERIRVVYRTTNGHISEASNSALEIAQGEFVALLDHDDVLPEHALYYVVNELNEHPEADLLYSDEDKLDKEGNRFGAYFKTDWNPDLFYAQNMFSHLGVYRRSLLEKIGGFRKGYEGSQDYDLCLRCLPFAKVIRHIPKILYHWRAIPGSTALTIDSKSYAISAARKAMKDFFDAWYPGVTVSDADQRFGYHRIVWPVPEQAPKVSIIIPTRDNGKILRQCIDSIERKTDYSNYHILVVNNQSKDPETLAYFKELAANPKVRIWDYDHPFNFSALNNAAVKQVDGEILLFMNDDIEVRDKEWLREMVSHCLRPHIGAVGARLLFPGGGRIQHAGVLLGIGEHRVAGHQFYLHPVQDTGYYARAILTHCLSAVTAACMAMRRSIFEEVGGYDEGLVVAYNDIDLCLRVKERGYQIIYTPYAELYHHESLTRGKDISGERLQRFLQEVAYMRKRWIHVLDNDPYYNPNADLNGGYTQAFPPRVHKPWMIEQQA